MPPGTPIVPATTIPTIYGSTENVIIDGETSPLVAVVVHDESNGDHKHPVYRDVPFAILFIIHALLMAWLGIFVAPKGIDSVDINMEAIENEIREGNDATDEDIKDFEQFVTQALAYLQVYPLRIVLYIVAPCCLLAYIFGAAITAFVIKPFPKTTVYACLVSSVGLVAGIMLFSAISSGSSMVLILTGLALAASLYYVNIAWRMVPFAAVNLRIALEGMGKNSGIYIVAFIFAELGFCWVLYWMYVLVGTNFFLSHECQARHPGGNFDLASPDYDDSCDDPSALVIVGFLLSLYWTNTVIMNTMQVTVSGVMATWCFDKTEADGCCSRAIHGSVYRSMTYSFGSICFGSLLQAVVSVFRYLVESARNQRNRDNDNACCGLLLCLLECFARLFEDILEYFNQWAYVFVGIYGYSYLESGRRVMELFRARGFTAVITDNLVGYVLSFVTFTVAMLTGFAGLLLESYVTKHNADSLKDRESFVFGPLPAAGFAFGIAFVVGLWIMSVMTSVVKGAVNTLIVCWADSPATMEMQHPALSRELATCWSAVFTSLPTPMTPAVIV